MALTMTGVSSTPVVTLREIDILPDARGWMPRSLLGFSILKARPFIPADLWLEIVDRIKSTTIMESQLELTVHRPGVLRRGPGRWMTEYLGVVGRKVVTNNGVGYIVDAFQNLVEVENQKFHALGTGSTAEAAGDSALVTELTTEYTGNVRATGTTTESASNAYQTVGTNTLDGTPGAALREHGILSQAATGGGVLLDRTVFSAITLSSGEALTSTYTLTFTAGG